MKYLKLLAGIIGALITILGGAYAVENHYAKKCDVAELSQSFRRYQVEQQADQTTQRLWDTEDRLKKQPTNEELQERRRELEERKRRLEQQLKNLDKGGL